MTTPHTVDVSTPGDREVRVTRVFDAPRELVYEAHTNPDLVRRWMLGPACSIHVDTPEENVRAARNAADELQGLV